VLVVVKTTIDLPFYNIAASQLDSVRHLPTLTEYLSSILEIHLKQRYNSRIGLLADILGIHPLPKMVVNGTAVVKD